MLANPATAQKHCFPAASFGNYLRAKYQEVLTHSSLSNKFPTTWIEVWASPGGATWTLVELSHHGIRCVIRTGENWRPVTTKRGQPL